MGESSPLFRRLLASFFVTNLSGYPRGHATLACKGRRSIFLVRETRWFRTLSAGVYIMVFPALQKNTAYCVSGSVGVQVGCPDGHHRRNFHGDTRLQHCGGRTSTGRVRSEDEPGGWRLDYHNLPSHDHCAACRHWPMGGYAWESPSLQHGFWDLYHWLAALRSVSHS